MNNNISIGDLFGLGIINSNIALGSEDPRIIVARLINLFLGFLGIITLLMIVSGGVQWMFSMGDEEKTSRARRTMISAIIGLIIILSANSIVLFITNAFSQ